MVTKERQGGEGLPHQPGDDAGGVGGRQGQHAELPARRKGHTTTWVSSEVTQRQQLGAGQASGATKRAGLPSQGFSPQLRGLELARGGFYFRKLTFPRSGLMD